MDIHKLINCASKQNFWRPKENQIRITIVYQAVPENHDVTGGSNRKIQPGSCPYDKQCYCCVVCHEKYDNGIAGRQIASTKSLLDQVKHLRHKES